MFSGLKYRFMVMHRYGEDIEKKFTAAGRQFGMKTVCYLALRMVSIPNSVSFSHQSGGRRLLFCKYLHGKLGAVSIP